MKKRSKTLKLAKPKQNLRKTKQTTIILVFFGTRMNRMIHPFHPGTLSRLHSGTKTRLQKKKQQIIIRCRHIIRNLTIRNRDSRRLLFLNFLLWVKELASSDCKFGFYMKNCIYSQLDMSRTPKFGPKIRNYHALAPKSAISYRMSPP